MAARYRGAASISIKIGVGEGEGEDSWLKAFDGGKLI